MKSLSKEQIRFILAAQGYDVPEADLVEITARP
jgi:hypothetical protein